MQVFLKKVNKPDLLLIVSTAQGQYAIQIKSLVYAVDRESSDTVRPVASIPIVRICVIYILCGCKTMLAHTKQKRDLSITLGFEVHSCPLQS